MNVEVLVTRAGSIAEGIERLIRESRTSVDAALYRLNNPRLAQALAAALGRGVRVRLVLDHGKYSENQLTRQLLTNGRIPFRLLHGREGPGSKMHHKFAILDGRTALTGSYNWTLESEEQNYDSLVILRDVDQIEVYQREFEALWADAAQASKF